MKVRGYGLVAATAIALFGLGACEPAGSSNPLIVAEVERESGTSIGMASAVMMKDMSFSFIDDADVQVDSIVLPALGLFGIYGGFSGTEIDSNVGDTHTLQISWAGTNYSASAVMPVNAANLSPPGDNSDSSGTLTLSYEFTTAPMMVGLEIFDSKKTSDNQPDPLARTGDTSGSFTIPANYLSPGANITLTLKGINYSDIESAYPGSMFEVASTASVTFTTAP